MQQLYLYEQDPGHGWLRVQRCELIRLGIDMNITAYSYQKGDMVFLEEDCDMSLFLTTKEAAGESFELHHTHVDTTRIRDYAPYSPLSKVTL